MKEFNYKARGKDGAPTQGLIEAESEQAASSLLVSKGIFPIDIREASKSSLVGISFGKKISRKDKVFFVRQLATMTGAGLPIAQAFATLQEQTSKKNVKTMIEQMIRDIEAGGALSAAFGNFPETFNKTDISILASGEASGKIEEVLLHMADQTEKNYKTIKKIKTVFIYPAFLTLVVVGVVAGLITFVLPQMEGLYSGFGADLPIPTRILISVSHFLRTYFVFIILFFFAVFVALRMYIKKNETAQYVWHRLKLSIPVVGAFVKLSYLSIFTRTLSSLIASGVPILDALQIVSEAMPNVIYSDAISRAKDEVKQGKSLSTSLKKEEIFPIMVAQMIAVGESTGELDKMLQNMAEYYDDELDNMTKSMQSLIEPIMIVVMGSIVGVIMICILLPIYNVGVFTKK
ncbi:MAG: type II secretion system F family protein [Patescibacteria group bacterium]